MKALHITQGGVENDDKRWLERAARRKLTASEWTVPKNVSIGDDVVIYVTTFGFFATAHVASLAQKRENWPNRYGSRLDSIRLIEPAISLAAIQRHIPGLIWANYPRSITTPSDENAAQIRALIAKRRRTGIPDLDDAALDEANIDELRKIALLRARPTATAKERKVIYRARSLAIHKYVLARAAGDCEGCRAEAPFQRRDGTPFLEPHHTTRLADDGPDHPAHVIALCPNCHRRAHHAEDAAAYSKALIKRAERLERGK
ncbi:MAG: HNH endonuclease signature motif containing protein [Planctomycetaceae bacterium]|nr:HNH endonuclease signature motif containing protein [Planctomycetaceae bacterium]